MADPDAPRNADFVARVVSDPNNPPETRMLSGWLGDAAEEGYRRLYTNADLSAYVDLPEDAILHSEPLRDVQPPGGVLVWVKSDAALKPGGSASSRAARFLQGAVTRDFAAGAGNVDLSSPEKAGYRCVTQVPCGEVTGFTGQCTKQPEVGGAWPCITALPHCAEPTGFTGQCTHQPWPHPTRYVGCTFLHCPTHDLTCIPQICHIVATGLPGCGVVDPGRVGGDPAAKAGLAVEGGGEAREGGGDPAVQPATRIPGCGYTQTWGLCETHLLGCGFTKTWGACHPTQPPKCVVSMDVPCITQDLACGPTRNPACIAAGAGFAAFRAAQGPGPVITEPILQCNPSAVDACPTRIGCETQPPTAFCTQVPGACKTDVQSCPETSCGPQCQTQQPDCTQINCTQVGCTQMSPLCPSIGIACTIVPVCAQAFRAAGPGQTAVPGCVQTGNNCLTIPDGDCTFFGGCQQTQTCPTQPQGHCTCAGPGCPPPVRQPQNFAAAAAAQAGTSGLLRCTQPGFCPPFFSAFEVQCPQVLGTIDLRCQETRFPQCIPSFPPLCPVTAACPPTPAQACPPSHAVIACTGFGPQCQAHGLATAGGPQCQEFARVAGPGQQEPTPATVCFICTNVPRFCWPPVAAKVAAPWPQDPTPATICFICTNVPQFCYPPVAQ